MLREDEVAVTEGGGGATVPALHNGAPIPRVSRRHSGLTLRASTLMSETSHSLHPRFTCFAESVLLEGTATTPRLSCTGLGSPVNNCSVPSERAVGPTLAKRLLVRSSAPDDEHAPSISPLLLTSPIVLHTLGPPTRPVIVRERTKGSRQTSGRTDATCAPRGAGYYVPRRLCSLGHPTVANVCRHSVSA